MKTWRRRLLALVLLGATLLAAPAGAHDPNEPMPGADIKGPFTVKGLVLDPDGRPIPNYPLRLYPVLPAKGIDRDNSYYQIPDRDEHYTKTDAAGRFVMTNVIDYPQVKHRLYKLFRGDFDVDLPLVPGYQTDIVNLNKATSTTIELTVRMEPAATLRIILKDRNGRRFTGTKAVSIATGKGRRYVSLAEFKNGVATMYVHPGDPQTPGRVILLRWEDPTEAKRQAREHGQLVEGQGQGRTLVTYGVIAQRNVALLPGQTITLEFVVEPKDLD